MGEVHVRWRPGPVPWPAPFAPRGPAPPFGGCFKSTALNGRFKPSDPAVGRQVRESRCCEASAGGGNEGPATVARVLTVPAPASESSVDMLAARPTLPPAPSVAAAAAAALLSPAIGAVATGGGSTMGASWYKLVADGAVGIGGNGRSFSSSGVPIPGDLSTPRPTMDGRVSGRASSGQHVRGPYGSGMFWPLRKLRRLLLALRGMRPNGMVLMGVWYTAGDGACPKW